MPLPKRAAWSPTSSAAPKCRRAARTHEDRTRAGQAESTNTCWCSLTTPKPTRSGNGSGARPAKRTRLPRVDTFTRSARLANCSLFRNSSPLAFSLEEEPSIAEVTGRLASRHSTWTASPGAFLRQVFKAEREAFSEVAGQGYSGVETNATARWYASVMLDRLMFVYFIQNKGFLFDGDRDYLRNRLKSVQKLRGQDRFISFYQLLPAAASSTKGWASRRRSATPDLEALIGDVPIPQRRHLRQVHEIEGTYPKIQIRRLGLRQALRLLRRVRRGTWTSARCATDREINPDVLGYIFEKFVNQKQMGAYYTKEDITGYIARNTIIPRLFDMARKNFKIDFRPNSSIWSLLTEDPDRYIYPAMRQGIDAPLPTDIAAGLDDIARRPNWNAPAADGYALPTETWREHVARRQRYEEVRTKLVNGSVRHINDLISLNLDIQGFAHDVILDCDDPDLLRAFWKSIRGTETTPAISILDPACGSGAFLFAALNVLEPLYDACLERMEAFIEDLDNSHVNHSPAKFSDFRAALAEVGRHPNRRYFILKSIVIDNLYGVDIMEEAVEICKLRLFLKLAAQADTIESLEPLPDIDFNIRAGNSLVGFRDYQDVERAFTYKMDLDDVLPKIQDEAWKADKAFARFRTMQTTSTLASDDLRQTKVALQKQLARLRDELDRYLASEYHVLMGDEGGFRSWRNSHRPLHWFLEYYGKISNGGFDVLIGNPPYVARRSIGYKTSPTADLKFPDIYADVLLRSQSLTTNSGRCGFIVPLSIMFSTDFVELRSRLTKRGGHWFSSYDNIPASVFSGVSQRCTMWLADFQGSGVFTTTLQRWRSKYRPKLVSTISYCRVPTGLRIDSYGVPKLSESSAADTLALHMQQVERSTVAHFGRRGAASHRLGVSPTARNFISTYLESPPIIDVSTEASLKPTHTASIPLSSRTYALAALAATSGDSFFWYWLTRGDGFHVTMTILKDFLSPLSSIPEVHLMKLASIGEVVDCSRFSALVFKKNAGKYIGNYNYNRIASVTRRADLVFMSGLGAKWSQIERILSYTSLVRSVNSSTGEKNIPDHIRSRFAPGSTVATFSEQKLDMIDEWLSGVLSVDIDQIEAMPFA